MVGLYPPGHYITLCADH